MERGNHWLFVAAVSVGATCVAVSITDDSVVGYLLGFANLAAAVLLLVERK
jgi:hypothetical protein